MSSYCKTCGRLMDKKSYKKYGVILLVSCLPMVPLLFFLAYGTIVPLIYAAFAIFFGFLLVFRRDKYFYFCRKCQSKSAFSG